MARRQLTLDNEVASELAGSDDAVLRELERRLGCEIYLRGNILTLDGGERDVARAATMVDELVGLVERGHTLGPETIDTVTGAIDAQAEPAEMLEDVIWRHRSLRVAPKTVNQKRYVDAIRTHTVTFGIGPAGTGKTFLAVAMAVAALDARDVNRIILTRPAVEAGERLGFLPGDIQAKVDPYLRPLFDALYDMLDPERVSTYFDRGIIEVAPLAFMRGRAQPVTTPVLTPSGFRPIGELQVGDLVIGSSGRPTPVIGVYPQGRREVFRVWAQDGASTVCCAEHLWLVRTPSDRRPGERGRVLRTHELAAGLRAFGPRRYELPLLRAPAELRSRAVPADPYALGLALGGAPELAPRTVAVGGGVAIADPVTAAAREPGLAGTSAGEAFAPETYLNNEAAVRTALLQGLLDAGGDPATGRGRRGSIELATRSERLRDDVLFLVRSLGGVAAWRSRSGEFVCELRLPAGIEPFRLAPKRELYERERARERERDEAGGPVRFLDSIEPAGEAETVCIEVAAADSLYVTEDFLLTHNTVNDSFVILDEAQNTTPEQMKMFLTRLGFGSKMVVTGDITQIDLPRDQRSGLVVVREILAAVDDIAFIRFGGEDVVRHQLVQRIVAAYGEFSEREQAGEGAPQGRDRREGPGEGSGPRGEGG